MVLAGLVTWVGCGKPGLSVYTNVAIWVFGFLALGLWGLAPGLDNSDELN